MQDIKANKFEAEWDKWKTFVLLAHFVAIFSIDFENNLHYLYGIRI
jgi:hypothetical protein